MSGPERDIIGGFNSMIELQKEYGQEALFLDANIDAAVEAKLSASAPTARWTTSATRKVMG